MTDLDLDDDLRTAFTAPRLDPALRARLLAPARPRIGANLALAAGILLTLGLAGVPAVELALTYATASGWVGAPRVDLPMSAFDRWIPNGSAVTPYVMRGDDRHVFGVQRLIAGGDRMQLELLDPASWGDGPPGEVRLARIDGPLVELALPGERAPIGVVVHDADRNPIEAVGRVPGALIVRVEGPLQPCLDCAGLPNWSGEPRPFMLSLPRGDGASLRSGPRLHDATTGMALGVVDVLSNQTRDGMDEGDALVSGVTDFSRRSIRAVEEDGERSRIVVPDDPAVEVWDRVALFESIDGALVPRARDAVVDRRSALGLHVSVPVQDVPALLRARSIQARVVAPVSGTDLAFELVDVDGTLLTLEGVELVAVGRSRAVRLGAVDIRSVDRSGPVVRFFGRTDRAAPPDLRVVEYRVIQPAPKGFRLLLHRDERLPNGGILPVTSPRRVTPIRHVELVNARVAVVQVAADDVEEVLRSDFLHRLRRDGLSADAPPAASSPPSPPAGR